MFFIVVFVSLYEFFDGDLGTTLGYIQNEGDMGDALKQGWSGAYMGALSGAGSGLWRGRQNAKEAKLKALTEKRTEYVTKQQDVNTQGGNQSVYEGVDPNTGQVKYVGITGREPEVRYAEHSRAVGTGKEALTYRVVESGLSKAAARVVEQNLINTYGLSGSGGHLLNIRNSIAPQYWRYHGIMSGGYHPGNLLVK